VDIPKQGEDLDEVTVDAELESTGPSATQTPTAAPPAAPRAAAPAPRSRRVRLAVVVPIALALAAGVALVIEVASSPDTVGAGRPEDAPLVHAAALRRDARDACASRSWKTCLDELDEARGLDPSSNETSEIQSLRHAAADGVGHP
jgi:hypothetical protein